MSKECEYCGNPLPKGRRKFCSDECQQKNFQEKIAPLWWPNACAMALERAGNRCEECGSTSDLQVHHKDPLFGEQRFNNPKNRLDNLLVLCRECHWKKHRHGGKPKTTIEKLIEAGQLSLFQD